MHRFRILTFVLGTLALAAVASAPSSTATPADGSYCNKLCIIGYHCVPNPNGGVCVPNHGVAERAKTASKDSIETTSRDSFCNKLCAIGFHCVPNPNGGVCVPDHGLVEAAPIASEDSNSTEMTPVIGNDCGENLSSSASSDCGPCTIICPAGTHLVQTGNCECKCVGNPR